MKIDFIKSTSPYYSDEVKVRLEDKFGIKFPNAYIELMKNCNGGHLSESLQVPIRDIPEELRYYLGDGFWGVHEIAGISDNPSNSSGILYKASTAHDWDVPERVISFCGDGHTWVAFDYREPCGSEPKIIFIETDEMKFHVLANSFKELLDIALPYSSVFDEDGEIIYKHH